MRLARVRRRKHFLLLAIAAVLLTTMMSATAAPGDLDPTFDGDGKVTTHFIYTEEARGVAIQSDGNVVAAGVAICEPCLGPVKPHDFALARYNRDGSLDTTFDGDGKVTTDFSAREDEAFAVAIQGDGKIVAAGSSIGPGALDFALARYNADGSLDTTFDGDGKVTTDFAGGDDQARGVAIQKDGKIVAAGVAVTAACIPCDGPATENFGLARYNLDGSLDTSFGFFGTQVTDFGGPDEARGISIQTDGLIVAAGVTICDPCVLPVIPVPHDFALARYEAGGSPDTTFGQGGTVRTDFEGNDDEAFGVAVQGDGKIVAGGSATPSEGAGTVFALSRYSTDGSLDGEFDVDGKVLTAFSGSDQARGVAIQRDGKIVAAGLACANCFAGSEFGVARYTLKGSLDTTFSGDGLVMADFGFANDQALAVALQTDGKIVAAGVAGDDFALTRYKVCRVSSRRSSIPCR